MKDQAEAMDPLMRAALEMAESGAFESDPVTPTEAASVQPRDTAHSGTAPTELSAQETPRSAVPEGEPIGLTVRQRLTLDEVRYAGHSIEQVGMALKRMGPEAIRGVINQGLQASPDAGSHIRAQMLQKKLEAGQDATPSELGHLYDALCREPTQWGSASEQDVDQEGLTGGKKIDSQEGAESGTIKEINHFSKEGELSGEGKAESRRDFLARVHDGTRRGGEVGEIAYSYVPVGLVDASKCAQEAEAELKALGIECFFHNGLEYNLDEETYLDHGEAATIGQKIVAIFKNATANGKEIAGHELVHVKMGTMPRAAFERVFRENINMFSVYAIKQGDIVLKNYLGGELTDKSTFFEEFLGRICGQIHSGEYDADLRTIFRNFDAVKAAWETFIQECKTGGSE